jgi:hypothetical protein
MVTVAVLPSLLCRLFLLALASQVSPGQAIGPAVSSFGASLDQSSLGLGRVVKISINASAFAKTPNGTIFWPFVNHSQWGSFVTCRVEGRDDQADGGCTILLPLPYVGTAKIKVAVLNGGRLWGGHINASDPSKPCDETRGCVFVVGTPFPTDSSEVLATSRVLSVEVIYRRIQLAPAAGESKEICMDWEPWHTKVNTRAWIGRPGASAMPLVGMYSSFHPGVQRQHAIWLVEAGVTCIEIDWSNTLWGHQKWAGHEYIPLNNATYSTLSTYAAMRAEGHDTPKALFMIGLQNGPPATPSEVGKEAAFIYEHLVVPLGAENFVALEGKPLLLVLFCALPPPNASVTEQVSGGGRFTVRWMGTQLQANPGEVEAGYWSWMDGTLSPLPARRPDGTVEALTVTPAFFAGGGWLAPAAAAQNRGSTLTAEMNVANRLRPTVLLVCQWNEWAGQPDAPPGSKTSTTFVDAFNLSFTNDLEPTALAECGGYQHRDDAGQLPVCDTAWGFFNLNLLSALLQSYRESLALEQLATPTTALSTSSVRMHLTSSSTSTATTVLRISSPHGAATFVSSPPTVGGNGTADNLHIAWAVAGPNPGGKVRVEIVGQPHATMSIEDATTAVLDMSQVASGVHTVRVTAMGGFTTFPLARALRDIDLPSAERSVVAAADEVRIDYRKKTGPAAFLETRSLI